MLFSVNDQRKFMYEENYYPLMYLIFSIFVLTFKFMNMWICVILEELTFLYFTICLVSFILVDKIRGAL